MGIPQALLYYRYQNFWKNYLSLLGYSTIESPITTKEIVEVGKKYSPDESCLPFKIYIGHINYLKDKCDYILIPRVSNYGKGKSVCVKFNATYDITHNIFKDIKIIDYNIDAKDKKNEFSALIKLGIKLNKNIFKVLISYFKAKKVATKSKRKEEQAQSQKLTSSRLKILISAHTYVMYDEYLGTPIIKKLKEQNVEIIYSDRINPKKTLKLSKKLSPTLYWLYSKEQTGSLSYYQNKIDGIIYLTAFPCGPDSLVNELMLRKIKNIPSINLIIDDETSLTGIETRIESFIDIIKERRNHSDKNN